jgi:hypothetical protein
VPPAGDRYDEGLIALVQETRRVAETMMDAAIRSRLLEIANEVLDLASPREKSG